LTRSGSPPVIGEAGAWRAPPIERGFKHYNDSNAVIRSGSLGDPNLFGQQPKPKPKKTAPKVEAPSGAVQRLIGIWCGLFERKFGEKPVITGRDGAVLKRLAVAYGVDAVERRLQLFIDLDDAFLVDAGYPLTLFESKWNKFAVAERRKEPRSTVPSYEETQRYRRKLRGEDG
jgi:hypothetical protein